MHLLPVAALAVALAASGAAVAPAAPLDAPGAPGLHLLLACTEEECRACADAARVRCEGCLYRSFGCASKVGGCECVAECALCTRAL